MIEKMLSEEGVDQLYRCKNLKDVILYEALQRYERMQEQEDGFRSVVKSYGITAPGEESWSRATFQQWYFFLPDNECTIFKKKKQGKH